MTSPFPIDESMIGKIINKLLDDENPLSENSRIILSLLEVSDDVWDKFANSFNEELHEREGDPFAPGTVSGYPFLQQAIKLAPADINAERVAGLKWIFYDVTGCRIK